MLEKESSSQDYKEWAGCQVGETNPAHDFSASLAKSHSASDLPIWEEVYRKAFPNFGTMQDCRQDGDHQRAGIDRVVIETNGVIHRIDEKARFKRYNDILLEYWSDEARRVKGWVCKPLMADYIAYAILPSKIAYLLPVPQLQGAWIKHSEDWKKTHRCTRARNNGYVTVGVAVPVTTLFRAIGECLRIRFSACP